MSHTSHSHRKANVYQSLTRNKTIDDTAFFQNVSLSGSFYIYILKVATFCDEWLEDFFGSFLFRISKEVALCVWESGGYY